MDNTLLYIVLIIGVFYFIINNQSTETLRNIRGGTRAVSGGRASSGRASSGRASSGRASSGSRVRFVEPTTFEPTTTIPPTTTPMPTLAPTIAPASIRVPRVTAIKMDKNKYYIKDNLTGEYLSVTSNGKLKYDKKPSVFSFNNGNLILANNKDKCLVPVKFTTGASVQISSDCDRDKARYKLDSRNRIIPYGDKNKALGRFGNLDRAALIGKYTLVQPRD